MIWTWKMLAISTVFAALITSPLAPVIWPAVLLIISVLAGVTALILQHTPLSRSLTARQPQRGRLVNAWTDKSGVIHIKTLDGKETLCGLGVAPTFARPVRTCETCIWESIRDAARQHHCGPHCTPP
ncbi:hypothetical protein [Saccharopolyspora rectivirgula]|nr:hypothetical protein [Saccharopolyspora rectivirgula]